MKELKEYYNDYVDWSVKWGWFMLCTLGFIGVFYFIWDAVYFQILVKC